MNEHRPFGRAVSFENSLKEIQEIRQTLSQFIVEDTSLYNQISNDIKLLERNPSSLATTVNQINLGTSQDKVKFIEQAEKEE